MEYGSQLSEYISHWINFILFILNSGFWILDLPLPPQSSLPMKKPSSFSIPAGLRHLLHSFAQQPDLALKAYELRMNGHPYEALSYLDSTLALYPDSARLWFEQGRTHDWVKADGCTKFIHAWFKMAPRITKSSKSLKKACKLDPKNARYHNWYSGVAATQSLLYIYTPWEMAPHALQIKICRDPCRDSNAPGTGSQ